jgi:hypothetical protein
MYIYIYIYIYIRYMCVCVCVFTGSGIDTGCRRRAPRGQDVAVFAGNRHHLWEKFRRSQCPVYFLQNVTRNGTFQSLCRRQRRGLQVRSERVRWEDTPRTWPAQIVKSQGPCLFPTWVKSQYRGLLRNSCLALACGFVVDTFIEL